MERIMVLSREGEKREFDITRITKATEKAFEHTGTAYNQQILDKIALKAINKAERQARKDGDIDYIRDHLLKVETIQDGVVKALYSLDFDEEADAYKKVRTAHARKREVLDAVVTQRVNNYARETDDFDPLASNNNASQPLSISGLHQYLSGEEERNYWDVEYDKRDPRIRETDQDHRRWHYTHDKTMLSGYCAGWSLKKLIKTGIISVGGNSAAGPATHLDTLCVQMVNFLGIMQAEWAGAQAFSSFDTYLAPFLKADCAKDFEYVFKKNSRDEKGAANREFQIATRAMKKFIYGVNVPSRWGSLPPFSNITLDWAEPPKDLANKPAIVGGKDLVLGGKTITYRDCKHEMDVINRAFLVVMTEGDPEGRGFQYPIPSYSITKDFDWSDTENNRLLFEMTAKYGTPNFMNYVNSDMDPTDVRSMCPLYSKERVLVKDDYSKEFHVSTVENLYKGNKAEKTYTVLLNGQEKTARLNRFDNLDFYEITLVNGHKVKFSGNHQNLTMDGIKTTEELTTDDYLPFETVATEGEGLTFEDGYMVGAFMGDGSIKDDYAVTYSLNDTSKILVMDQVARIGAEKFGAKVNIGKANEKGTCLNMTLTSKMLRGLIEDYVSGKGLDKNLDVKAIGKSVAFREGIITGLMDTDGNKASRRIYTASEKAVESICAIFASLGVPTSIRTDERDSTETLSDNPVYCIRPYDVKNGQKSYGDIYRKADGYMWFRIESIEKMHTESKIGYCFEVLNDDEPYFMMPSGLVTHNCRLRLDLRELRRKAGGNFGAGEETGSIGVETLNMPLLAYESKSREDFYRLLDEDVDICVSALNIKREVIQHFMDKGLYPYSKFYLASNGAGNEFKNHFSTIGVVGMNEMCLNIKWEHFGDLTNEASREFCGEVLDHIKEKLSDYQVKNPNVLYNLEATPAESTAHKLARGDKREYPDIITAGSDEAPYYTNSSALPVNAVDDIFDALEMQDPLQVKYTSGTIFHTFLGERLSDWRSAAALVKAIASNYKLPTFTLSPTYSICPDDGYIAGEHFTCPHCGKPAQVFSRITGYYRPVANFNDGKKEEFRQRALFDRSASDEKEVNAVHGFKKIELGKSEDKAAEIPANNPEQPILLVKEDGCPKCKQAEAYLNECGKTDKIRIVPVGQEGEGFEYAVENNIMTAPAIIAGDKVIRNLDGVLDYIKKEL